jgi:Ca-activated chloride channel family protein
LLAAFKDSTPNDQTHLRQVIFLTDGEVGNEAELFTAIDQKIGRSRLFTVGIGSAPNAYFMSGAARAGRGTYTYVGAVDQVSERMAELFSKLEHPVMTELSARWPDGLNSEAWPNPLPDLYDGQPIVVSVKADKADGTLVLSGNLDGTVWRTTLDLSQARPASGIEKLWARTKIATLDESRVRGFDSAYIDSQVLDVALAHHLTSRLTSLVAVDVTRSRPVKEDLTSANVPINLPDGWDADAFLGETRAHDDQHASLPPAPPPPSSPAPAGTQLALLKAPAAAVATEDAGVVLPQTGTDSRLMFALGLLFLVIAGGLMLRKRIASEGNR